LTTYCNILFALEK